MTNATHKPQRNSPERADMLADRADEQRRRVPRITRTVSKPRFSKRGEPGQTWRTKAWTPARWRDLSEILDGSLWANADLAERDNDRFRIAHGRLGLHLAAHPHDGCARAALDRLTG